ncbi:MAG TPA: AAA family ATPase [Rubrobacteraceae bacterium]
MPDLTLRRRHVVLKDIPGVDKTTLAMATCSSIATDFLRIQFTSARSSRRSCWPISPAPPLDPERAAGGDGLGGRWQSRA